MLNLEELKTEVEFYLNKIPQYSYYIRLVSTWEQLKTLSYQDSKGIWTVGFGHIKGVAKDLVISEYQAYWWLLIESQDYINNVDEQLKDTELHTIQLQALYCLCYNIGITAFNNSTLLKTIKNDPKNIIGISEQWLSWDYAGESELNGLLKRRIQELDYYSNFDKYL